MTARDHEAALLTRCVAAAREPSLILQDQMEANVFRLAAMVLRSRYPDAAKRLTDISDQYFTLHPHDKLAAEEVLRKGWVSSLPRLRDMLSHQLQRH